MRWGSLVFLVVSQTLFLWMFLSADPLEQLANGYGSRADAVMQFAAQWRHGMAGNSPLYLPGFFMTAAAVWMYARGQPGAIAHAGGVALAAVIAFGAAGALAPWGAEAVVRAFDSKISSAAPASIPRASLHASMIGGYTLLTWATFVTCARTSLVRRSFSPLLLPAALTVGLVLVRPFTADDFTRHWAVQVVEGDLVAWLSLLSVIGLATALVKSEPTGATTTRLADGGGRDAARQSRTRGSR
jgi:hypothetical protein